MASILSARSQEVADLSLDYNRDLHFLGWKCVTEEPKLEH